MKCLDTIFINNPKRDFGEPEKIPVPCGKCAMCMENRRYDWSFRLQQELKVAKTAHFITLTYAPEYEPETGINIRDVQLFLKRLRKDRDKVIADHYLQIPGAVNGLKWPSIRYYLVGEYGERTERPHYHAIMFNMAKEQEERLSGIWGKGLIHIGKVNHASIHYVTGYVLKKGHYPPGKNRPFSLMSRKPGLGNNYLDKTQSWHEDEEGRFYVISDGYKQKLPKFYKDKLFSDEQKRNHKEKTKKDSEEKFWKNHFDLVNEGKDPGEHEQQVKDWIRHKYNKKQTKKL